MNILRNTKPIKLKFYTEHASAYEYLKPAYSSDYFPSWVSQLPNAEGGPTVKNCYGLRESFRKGFVVPLWSDFLVKTELRDDGSFQGDLVFSDEYSEALLEQGDSVMNLQNKDLLKLVSPWYCDCEEEVTFTMFENHFSKPDRGVQFLSGIVQFKYNRATNMFLYIDKKSQKVELEAGDIPVIFRQNSERPLEIESHYDPEKTKQLRDIGKHTSFFQNGLMKRRKFSKFKGLFK